MNARPFLACLAIVVLSACHGASSSTGPGATASHQAPNQVPTASAPGAAGAAGAGAPAGVTSCGEASVTLASSCPSQVVEGSACLAEAAAACRPAEYVQTSQTDEGGTVVTRYSVQREGAGCAVVLDTDWTRDPFGPAPRTQTRCRSADIASTASGCKVLHTIGCGDDIPVR